MTLKDDSAKAVVRCRDVKVACKAGSLIRKAKLVRHWDAGRSNTSLPSKPRDAKILLYGRNWDCYPAIGPSHPHGVDVEAGDWHANCVGHLSVGWIKGCQRLPCLRT
ncbi:hypothetical protein TNCV_1029701 [Trichonephila clavipes]|nr:hypothetical protein TNCV_1029701 [Trichonephila clavipes]